MGGKWEGRGRKRRLRVKIGRVMAAQSANFGVNGRLRQATKSRRAPPPAPPPVPPLPADSAFLPIARCAATIRQLGQFSGGLAFPSGATSEPNFNPTIPSSRSASIIGRDPAGSFRQTNK